MGKKIGCGVLAAILLVAIILGVSVSGTYNSLVQLDQATQSQWAQVQRPVAWAALPSRRGQR